MTMYCVVCLDDGTIRAAYTAASGSLLCIRHAVERRTDLDDTAQDQLLRVLYEALRQQGDHAAY